MGPTLRLVNGVSLQVSVIFRIGDKLPFPTLVLNSPKITHARSEKERGPCITEQAVKISKIGTKGNHTTISGLVERKL